MLIFNAGVPLSVYQQIQSVLHWWIGFIHIQASSFHGSDQNKGKHISKQNTEKAVWYLRNLKLEVQQKWWILQQITFFISIYSCWILLLQNCTHHSERVAQLYQDTEGSRYVSLWTESGKRLDWKIKDGDSIISVKFYSKINWDGKQ